MERGMEQKGERGQGKLDLDICPGALEFSYASAGILTTADPTATPAAVVAICANIPGC